MFVAAMLDAFPALNESCQRDLSDAGLLQHVSIERQTGHSQSLAVLRFVVTLNSHAPEHTGSYAQLQRLLASSQLGEKVRQRALSLLQLLAQAEAHVHGVPIADVHFHEIADWDSLVDIVAAASIIEHSAIHSWSCAPLPLGSGLVSTQHGQLPIPAPATAYLLNGLSVVDDGLPGERVTPTGAAIIRYLLSDDDGRLSPSVQRPAGRLHAVGCGAGQRNLPDRPNIVRCSVIEQTAVSEVHACRPGIDPLISTPAEALHNDQPNAPSIKQVVQIGFDIDDMTPEEISVALNHIRAGVGVLDANFVLGVSKKGRAVFIVSVLCKPDAVDSVSALCFTETSTLGLRVLPIERRVLERHMHSVVDEYGPANVKSAERPEGTTSKVESDDISAIPGLHARRLRAQQLREPFET